MARTAWGVRATVLCAALCAALVEGRTDIEHFSSSVATTAKLAGAGAEVVAEPTRTPWNSLNSRLEAPGALQLTLFTELGD